MFLPEKKYLTWVGGGVFQKILSKEYVSRYMVAGGRIDRDFFSLLKNSCEQGFPHLDYDCDSRLRLEHSQE
jgi:hypothetical protein